MATTDVRPGVPQARAARPAAAASGEWLPPDERAARGKAARARVPRREQAVWRPAVGRPDPVRLLESQAASRVPELVPIRYGRMLVSPFTFYRGAALLMASDLAATPHTGLQVQLCGDAHLANFGAFGSPERRLVFDINDFDETHPGPWEWDVKRLVASFEVACRDRGLPPGDRRAVVVEVARAYRTSMASFAAMGNLEVWYASLDVERLVEQLRDQAPKAAVRRVEAGIAKTRTRSSIQAYEKLTSVVDGRRVITSAPPLIVPVEEFAGDVADTKSFVRAVQSVVRSYRRSLPSGPQHLMAQYEYQHMARKVVGVGSVGTRCWVVLMRGRDESDPLFLQVKEAQPSVLEEFLGRSRFSNSGQRVVSGQRLMQSASDIFLGWTRSTGFDGLERDFYVRQLRDWKGSADLEQMRPATMQHYAQMCGWTLARAHARSGDRVALAAYLGRSSVFDEAVADFAAAYADQNERDYVAFREAVDSGRVAARTGL